MRHLRVVSRSPEEQKPMSDSVIRMRLTSRPHANLTHVVIMDCRHGSGWHLPGTTPITLVQQEFQLGGHTNWRQEMPVFVQVLGHKVLNDDSARPGIVNDLGHVDCLLILNAAELTTHHVNVAFTLWDVVKVNVTQECPACCHTWVHTEHVDMHVDSPIP
jgi:hypothetical protein